MGPSEEKAVCARGCIGHRDGGILVATRAVRVLKRAVKLPWTGGRAAASKLRYQSPDMGGEAPESAMWARAPTCADMGIWSKIRRWGSVRRRCAGTGGQGSR